MKEETMSKYIGITAAQARQITELAMMHEAERNELQECQRIEMQALEESQGRGLYVSKYIARIATETNRSDDN